jgi:hypothetical protein
LSSPEMVLSGFDAFEILNDDLFRLMFLKPNGLRVRDAFQLLSQKLKTVHADAKAMLIEIESMDDMALLSGEGTEAVYQWKPTQPAAQTKEEVDATNSIAAVMAATAVKIADRGNVAAARAKGVRYLKSEYLKPLRQVGKMKLASFEVRQIALV